MRFAGIRLATLLALCLLGSAGRLAAQGNPIDDVIKLAIDAWNDLKYPTADSIARRVLTMSSASPAQRLRAQMVMIAAAYPEEKADQKRTVALATLKQVLRVNYEAKMPPELSWAGLDSLVEEARKSTFGMQLTGESSQTAVGVDGSAKLHVKSNKPGLFRLIITSKANNSAVVVDSIRGIAEGEITFKTMRDEKPVFTTGDYNVMVTAFEPGARGDTVTAQYGLKVVAPAITLAGLPTKMDSSKLLKERTGKFGAKAILPALMVGGAAYFASSQLHGDGGLAAGETSSKGPDAAGAGVAGGLALVTMIAGFADHGRLIPQNVAANKAAGEAFQKSIADATAENRRRVTEHRTVLTFDFGGRP
jgi:hypothetical protein